VRDDEAAFVDSMGQLMSSFGLGPMAGRVWAWLLICEPPEQTAAELAESLKASRGAISGAAAFLAAARLIRRMRRRGDRREYFSIPAGSFDNLLRSGAVYYERLAEITSSGLATMAERDPKARVRLEEVHDATVFIASAFPAALDQYLRDRTPIAEPVPSPVPKTRSKESR
jgi:DNA-binding transcriptional regulator GbsR (MarR family)